MFIFRPAILIAILIAAAACTAQGQPSADGEATAEVPPAIRLPPLVQTPGPGEQAIVTVAYYDDEGFVPERTEVAAGQTVRFSNQSGEAFWPASNIHPTHQIYSDFDAGEPIPPGETWTFTFEEAGFWRYHNHLAPRRGGLVVVRGEARAQRLQPVVVDPRELDFSEPGAVSVQDAIDLFRDDALLARFVERYGPANTVSLLSENASQVGVDCHQRAHDLGRIAYEQFGASAFSLSGHECQSGGYHGATEALFRERGTTDLQSDIEAICDTTVNGFFRHQCVHGVGHGLMAWTSYEIFDALGLCDALQDVTDQLSCYSGVFMENVVGGLSGSMGHFTEYLSDDPHFPCNILEHRYLGPCYFYQTSRMVHLFGGDFERLAGACEEAPEGVRTHCFLSMGRDVGGASKGEPERAVRLCSNVKDSNHRIECLEGSVQDFFWDAGGADDALAFCGMLDKDEEKRRCYSTIAARAINIYQSPAQLQAFCGRIEEGYRAGCQ